MFRFIALVSFFSVSLASHAACVTSDLAGTWYLMGVTGDLYYGDMLETDRCKLVMTSTGTVSPSSSSCNARFSDGLVSYSVKSGKLYLNSACEISGSVSYCYSGQCATMKIERSAMNRDKYSMTLLGYRADNADYVLFATGHKK